jgi:cobyrinic acid a,c-diamide synthase
MFENPIAAPGLIIAAPASGSGKTTVTLALLRARRRTGVAVASFKVGPDYIDPMFHARASGRPCTNLDGWAMRLETLAALTDALARDAALVLGEGVMGLFDGAADGRGSTAELASLFDLPVVLVVDARGMAASAAALVEGFTRHRDDVEVAGVVFNRVGSEAHAALLRRACDDRFAQPVLGCLPDDPRLELPERHLGLVQAEELPAFDDFLDRAAAIAAEHIDLNRLTRLARPFGLGLYGPPARPLRPLGQRTAVALDLAFAFAYPATLDGWRVAGAEVLPFSPLADQAPDPHADAVYLPGGYPELHAERLAGNHGFIGGLRAAAERGAVVYGECGGFMALGERLVDRQGESHAMAGLLPFATSFAEPRLHLGYRRV